MKQYSSFKDQQKLVENFRRFLDEGGGEGIHGYRQPTTIKGRPDPRFGRMKIQFESDVDKALYIVYNAAKRSRKEPEFLSWLSNLGYTQDQMEREGEAIKSELKKQVSSHPDFPGWSGWSKMTGELSIPKMAEEPDLDASYAEEEEGYSLERYHSSEGGAGEDTSGYAGLDENGRKRKKMSMFEIKRRLSRARRKQNK